MDGALARLASRHLDLRSLLSDDRHLGSKFQAAMHLDIIYPTPEKYQCNFGHDSNHHHLTATNYFCHFSSIYPEI